MKTIFTTVAALQAGNLKSQGAIMAMPFTDQDMALKAADLAAARAGNFKLTDAALDLGKESILLAVHDTARQGFVSTINQAFAATQSPWFGYMAQDAFAGRNWLALALQKLHSQKEASLLAFNDGKWQGQLASFGLARREWVDKVYSGAFFFQGYQSHFADAELTLVARQQSVYAYEPQSVLMEVDWQKDQASVNDSDRRLFNTRKHTGFGNRVTDPQWLQLIS
jgi:hypothetical protein